VNSKRLVPLALALVFWAAGAALNASPPVDSAADLLARVVARQQTTGFTMRAKMTIQAAGTASQPVVVQIRALGKHDAKLTRTLYQALWPDALKGRAVIVDRIAGQPLQGSIFTPPDTASPITPAQLTEAVLGSDLTVEDLAAEFQWWPNPAFAGTAKVAGGACRVIESRPPAGVRSSYALVRSCVSESKLLVLRSEKIGPQGYVVKRITVTRTARDENGVVSPRTIEIQNVERGSTTTIDVTRGERDIVVANAEFSVSRLKTLGR
jgi:hypothetical protein